MDIQKLQELVKAGKFDTLIGQVENDWFDCKKEPYQIQNESAKRELAKDVSSFANVEGGFIFIGIRTKQSTEHFGDEVESIHPFAQSLVNTTQYKDILRAWIYPELEGAEIVWVETDVPAKTGIIVIIIPKQKDSAKPFLISKVLDGKKQVEMMFGYAQRKGDTSKPLSVIDLQRSLRSGFSYEQQLKDRLDGMETLLRDSVQHNDTETQKKTNSEKIEKRIEGTLTQSELKYNRSIAITAYTNQPTQLKTIFLSTDGSIRKTLENPPVLRRAGWNLRTLDQAKIVRGEMIRVENGKRIIIDLYRDGTLIFAGQGNHNFLAWHDEQKQKINPVALVEIIYEVISFYQRVIDDADKKPDSFTVRFDLKGLHHMGIKTGLAPYHIKTYAQMFDHERKDAPDDEMTFEKTFSVENYDASQYAYEVAREVYLWFGLEEDKIPYFREEDGKKVFDIGAIQGI